MKLSRRLETIASFVTPGNSLADIGTDHGYIPVSLAQNGTVPRALAMDLRNGPLLRAQAHIREAGVGRLVETRLSDGMLALRPGEADTVIIAGLGGELLIRILADGESVKDDAGNTLRASVKEFVLSPHTEWGAVRKYLRTHGYRLIRETVIFDEGKYYTVMKAVNADDPRWAGIDFYAAAVKQGIPMELCDAFGPEPVLKKEPEFLAFLARLREQYEGILGKLAEDPAYGAAGTEKARLRADEIRHCLCMIREVIE